MLLKRIGIALQERRSLEPWTLAEIAPTAGLSPAGLLKRFGSRQAILVALSRCWIDSIPAAPLGTSPPEVELRSWVERRFAADGPEGVAQGLVNLLDDLIDDELRELLAEGWAKEIRYLATLLGQMKLSRAGGANQCASLLFDALNGAMLRRATGPAAPGPTQVLDDLLEVWT
ncbi:TetR/AcrR family transcriptional regulator [Streptomyces sp. 3N207]|uniref:TetR/AcrR family transcriptional regulator n=1 Tax=Streptomyces sp. 3N207 TaxID=3457417 RepID=UPI003FD0E208